MPHQSAPNYLIDTLQLENNHIATLVSLPANPDVAPRGAILYIHGFVDYFYQDHVAQYFTGQGWAWYALDLRRNGRSLRAGQEPWYTSDLTEYYEEIDGAVTRIRDAGFSTIVLMGHSTGGLISSIWANDRRHSRPISALVLNSPWFDLQSDWLDRNVFTWVVRGVGRIRPLMNVPRGDLSDIFPRSIHRSLDGEWDFNPRWKPLTPQPVKMGFLGSVRAQQARLHKGLDVGVPVLMLRSDKSLLHLTEWEEAVKHADTVLDVEHMKKWLPSIGKNVTDAPLTGALHDVMLSAQPIRDEALETVRQWLDDQVPTSSDASVEGEEHELAVVI